MRDGKLEKMPEPLSFAITCHIIFIRGWALLICATISFTHSLNEPSDGIELYRFLALL